MSIPSCKYRESECDAIHPIPIHDSKSNAEEWRGCSGMEQRIHILPEARALSQYPPTHQSRFINPTAKESQYQETNLLSPACEPNQ